MHLRTLLALALTGAFATANPIPNPAPDPVPAPAPDPVAAPQSDSFVSLVPWPPSGGSFVGLGQLRARWNEGDYADLGCLTETGRWTTDEGLCATFRATPLDGYSTLPTYTLTSAAGPCWIIGAAFECGWGKEPAKFGLWPFPNSIPGMDCLRYGNYGLMSASKGGPPKAEDGPQEIHFTSYSDPGKWVWLTWKSIDW
ncbi:hypothetical protein VTK26DRAFT_7962 [Humicola hyalothermophila]